MKRRELIPKVKEVTLKSSNLDEILFNEILRFEGVDEAEVDKDHLSQEVKFFLLKLKTKLTACNRSYKKLEELTKNLKRRRKNGWME